MRKKILQIGNFYIRMDIPTFTYNDDELLGFHRLGGMYKACTDTTLSQCALFEFQEIKFGLVFISFAFGIEQQIDENTFNNATKDYPTI